MVPVIIFSVLILDQLTKWSMLAYLEMHRPIELLPFLNFRLAFNRGAAFSFLGDQSGWQRWFFIVVGLLACVLIVGWMRRLERQYVVMRTGLSLVLGGAIGNLIDRLRFGHVVDFIDVHYAGWHFPTFNVADSAITVGVVLIVLGEWQRCRKLPVSG